MLTETEFTEKLNGDLVNGKPESETEIPAGHFARGSAMLTQPTVLLARVARSTLFHEWLQDQKSRGVHYHLHSFSDGQLMILPPGTEVESEDGTHYTVGKDGNLICQRTARPTSKRARRGYSREDRKEACRRLHPEARKRSNWHKL